MSFFIKGEQEVNPEKIVKKVDHEVHSAPGSLPGNSESGSGTALLLTSCIHHCFSNFSSFSNVEDPIENFVEEIKYPVILSLLV